MLKHHHPYGITLTPGVLRPGMVVLGECGMRLLVEEAPTRSRSHPGTRTFRTHALLINRDDVPNDAVPYSWTRQDDGSHRWTIQGNDLARVHVESKGS